ncbi:hypothetical protein ACOMHN_065400 [Nucella lapillus]
MSQARWKSSKEEEQIGDVQEAENVVFVQGNAVSSNSKLQAGQDAENGQNKQCAAMRKIDLMNDFIDAADDTNNDMERCFMEFGCLKALLSVVTCQCGGNLHIQFGDKMGYSRQLKLACQDCTFVHQQFSCARVGGTTDVTAAFEVNNCITMCFNELGCGEAALRKFSGIMGIPGFAHNTYRRLSKKVSDVHAEVTNNVLTAAVAAVHRAYGDAHDSDGDVDAEPVVDSENEGENPGIDFDRDVTDDEKSDSSTSAIAVGGDVGDDDDDDDDDDDRGAANVGGVDERDGSDDDDIVDVTVSFDGTWHKRGFTSNYGVGIVIDVVTD